MVDFILKMVFFEIQKQEEWEANSMIRVGTASGRLKQRQFGSSAHSNEQVRFRLRNHDAFSRSDDFSMMKN